MTDFEAPSSPKMCPACGLSGRSSIHFGGSSCTACASFFRRTVSLNIRYVCKRDNDCISMPELRSICRACRYESCVAKAGMNRDMVQQRRNESRVPKYVLNSRKAGDTEIVRDYTTNSYTTLHEFTISDQLEKSSPEPEKSIESVDNPAEFSKILNISHQGLLEYYVEEVKRSMALKSKNILETSSSLELVRILNFHQELALETCTNCPGTDLLDGEDIQVLFGYCTFSSAWMDSIWMAAQENEVPKENKEEKVEEDSPLSRFIAQLNSTIIPSFSRLHLNIFEFAALKSFCIWKLGAHDSTISMKIVAQEQYLGVTSALRSYYETSTTMEPFEIATRIAEITLQIAPIFGVYRDLMSVYKCLGIQQSSAPSLEL